MNYLRRPLNATKIEKRNTQDANRVRPRNRIKILKMLTECDQATVTMYQRRLSNTTKKE